MKRRSVDPVQVMGVLNVTPDSFSDGGRYPHTRAALERVTEMIDEGARVVDVGGESTRPGADPVDDREEQARVMPVLEAVGEQCRERGVRLSIDTRNPSTARAAVRAGATLINDVSASLWPVAAELGVGWVAMHMAGDPRTMQRDPQYDDVVDHVRRFLAARAAEAAAAGVGEIWVDPGIGFGKNTAHNVALLARLDLLVGDGLPVMIGTSRKRSMGVLLAASDLAAAQQSDGLVEPCEVGGVEPVGIEDRLEGSLATAAWAIIQGVRMIRAHDVDITVRAAEAVCGAPDGQTGRSASDDLDRLDAGQEV